MSDTSSQTLDNLLAEDRTFPPSDEFAAQANLKAEAYDRAAADPDAFWAEQANRLSWSTPFTQVLDWSDAPHAKWFADGKLNVAYNCVDRHVEAGYRRHRRHPLGGRARRHPHHHLRRAAGRGLPRPPTRWPRWACRPATGSPSTCR